MYYITLFFLEKKILHHAFTHAKPNLNIALIKKIIIMPVPLHLQVDLRDRHALLEDIFSSHR